VFFLGGGEVQIAWAGGQFHPEIQPGKPICDAMETIPHPLNWLYHAGMVSGSMSQSKSTWPAKHHDKSD